MDTELKQRRETANEINKMCRDWCIKQRHLLPELRLGGLAKLHRKCDEFHRQVCYWQGMVKDADLYDLGDAEKLRLEYLQRDAGRLMCDLILG